MPESTWITCTTGLSEWINLRRITASKFVDKRVSVELYADLLLVFGESFIEDLLK
jgi:hypothetical protein